MRVTFLVLLATVIAIPVTGVLADPAPNASPPPKAVAAGPDAAAMGVIPLDLNEGRAVAEAIASELAKNFVNPAFAADYAAMLRSNAAAGRYDAGTRGALATRLTEDMMAVHKDGHLHVELATADGPVGRRVGGKPLPPPIQSAKWIAPGIAYIRPSIFNSSPEEVAAFKTFMEDHKTAKTIIFDMRNHHGGALGEMNVIFPYLFAQKTALVKMDLSRALFNEQGSPFGNDPALLVEKGPTMVTTTHFALPGPPTPLRTAKVLVLTSNATGSAAEHFSLAMKSSGRATLIGEATAGANHFGGPLPVNDHFAVWMPVGRTYDIHTGKDWEGVGVQPDIAVDPKLALVKALKLAGVKHAEAMRLNLGEVPAEPVHREKLSAR